MKLATKTLTLIKNAQRLKYINRVWKLLEDGYDISIPNSKSLRARCYTYILIRNTIK